MSAQQANFIHTNAFLSFWCFNLMSFVSFVSACGVLKGSASPQSDGDSLLILGNTFHSPAYTNANIFGNETSDLPQ
jgi:hypothetical protein